MDKLPPKPRKLKGATRQELLELDKNELVEKIIQLEAHCTQLRNIISKNLQNDSEPEKHEKKKPYDFKKCHFRRILLRILYFGWDYNGLAVQEDSNQTIEHHLFSALTRTCLIESRETSQYHRCGRTDKGVSAFGQVISITLRSKHPVENQHDIATEFDCKRRVYKYYFPRADLDLPAMRAACRHLIGSRDFRHLCKMDVGNGVTEFIRHLMSADILPVDGEGESPTTMYYLRIEGNAFLWHQIRCIMGVLLLVGQRKESPDVIAQLLDVENTTRRIMGLGQRKESPDVIAQLLDVDNTTRKPQYNMALDVPLNLFATSYDIDSDWYYDKEELKVVISHLQAEWTMHSVKTTMIKDCLQQLESDLQKICENGTKDTETSEIERDNTTYSDCLLQGVKPKVYTPLLKRETCSSLEERIEYYRKKRKVDDKSEPME
ncbi:tRNA pseudouridine synthase domain-containing protein [Phthorimaea operculella]|nr:tRNA pseudouridine synthase domain-containing protein [Phthorimaea operculella]